MSWAAQAAIPPAERAALVALYGATNGPGWGNDAGWMGPAGTECSWYGVTCDATGSTVTELDLNNNQLSGSIPPEMGDLASLYYLDLRGNQLSGSIPPEMGNLASLYFLDLRGNQLSGSIPPELGTPPSLKYLYLSSNPLSGSIPPELGNLASLDTLALERTQLTGSIPPELGNLASLRVLYLTQNPLTGSIPPEMGNLASLYYLDLSGNQLSGSIPPELANLPSLGFLDAEDNQLSGSIPPELGNAPVLSWLALRGNRLSGSIPPELGNLVYLRRLFLSGNQLSGSIPAELGNLTRLEFLHVSGNQLWGNLPRELANLTDLFELDMSWNALHTSDPFLRVFLDRVSPDWELTQTIAPTNVEATWMGGGTILVTWDPILYTQDTGGYRIAIGTTSGGPYTQVGMTSSKAAASMSVVMSSCGTSYVVVETQTDPHANNANTVISERSAEATATVGIVVSPSSIPGGRTGSPYAITFTASGGAPPYTFAVSAGVLPTGLGLSPAGLLSGTPSAAGLFPFTVSVTDAGSSSGCQSYTLTIDALTDYLAGEGSGPSNTNRVRIYTADGTATPVDFQAFGAGKWGTKVSAGDVDGRTGARWEIIAGPGPGAVYGPQVRAFAADGTPVTKVSFYAYSTLRYGVNPAAGLLDRDAFHEMLSGAGPGDVFGPHVRGWNFDGAAIAPIAGINFFAYSTLKLGVNVEEGDVDADGFAEILTGPGPGQAFGPQVRGWNHDEAPVTPIATINFLPAYTPAEQGVQVAGGDVDDDGFAEIATAPGPGPSLGARFLGFDHDGAAIALLPGFDLSPYSSWYGGRLGLGPLDQDARWDLITAAGPDPAAGSRVEGYAYLTTLMQIPSPFTPFVTAGYGYGCQVGAGMLGW